MAKGNNYKTTRLHNKSPYCHWCGKETFFNSVNGIQKHDTATLDHVYSKNRPEIRLFNNPKVLACYECNQRRNDEEQRNHEGWKLKESFYTKNVKAINGRMKIKFVLN